MNDPTESARALLFRHGLPEDVIDGALALHAQELAALQRLRMDELDLTGQKARIVGRIVDLIDPSLTSATPAGPAPATDGDTLRERIAALFRHPPGVERLGDATPGEIADAVLAVLLGPIPADTGTATWTAIRAIQLMNEARAAVPPAPDQQAAVWLDAATRLWHQTTSLTEYGRGARWAIGELRRLAGEAQQAPHSCGSCDGIDPDSCLFNPDRPSGRAAEAELYVLLRKAGEGRYEAQACIDRHRDEVLRRRAAADELAREVQQDPAQDGPRRGDQFEQWLTAQRDAQRDTGHGVWTTLDQLLDQYRQHANTGTPLGEHVCEGQAVGDCECLEPYLTPSGNVRVDHLLRRPTAVARSGQPETDEETGRG